jgi:uncharacterized protein
MEKLVIASIGGGVGKSSVIVGLAKVMNKPFGYLKPLGDRMIYRDKKVWDHDADVITKNFGIKEDPEELTIGFEHSKLRYMYDEEGRRKKLQEMVSRSPKEILFVEGGRGLLYVRRRGEKEETSGNGVPLSQRNPFCRRRERVAVRRFRRS